MIKVLIVDDEMISRIGIKSLIPWKEQGFTVVGEAENGKKALELILELRPDIVITDIKMPVMSGLNLIKKTQAELVQGQPAFIVLSSYDDFDYVKEALVLGAKDYFLKLELTPEKLLETLNRVSQLVSIEREQQNNNKKPYVEQLSANDYEIIKSNFLQEIIHGRSNREEDIDNKLIALEMRLPKERIQCGVILLHGMDVYQKYNDHDIHLFQFAVENIVSEIVSDYHFAHAVFTQAKEITVIFAHAEMDQMDKNMLELMNAIMKALQVYLNIRGLMGISKIREGYLSIKTSYSEALEDANHVIVQKGIRNYELGSEEPVSDMSDYIKQFELTLHVSEMDKMSECLVHLVEKIKHTSDISKNVLKSLCSTLLLSVHTYLNEYASSIKLEEAWGSDPYRSLEHLNTNYDFITWIEHLEKTMVAIFNSLGESRKLIHQAKQYIHKHYVSNVSLEAIADELNISPNYLSYLFRKETKESVVEYLTKYRINKAKDLLRTTHYKIYEVGQMVGYDSEQYFSRVFKKIVGMPPLKFKQ
ncbi:response regulator transcription factor [Paenibacillus segetis]|uniref:DNA-binding response regulator n=1 Tax=Paenibacillus segetis TaxID=1325360 RepID=A0ABQ1Y2Q9_9BACL|nr:response regulator [Paenibacillus segetis]GGH10492.1 DNA-binding response regulator [Paenibacillus segetis]